jgi:hypothetical protein
MSFRLTGNDRRGEQLDFRLFRHFQSIINLSWSRHRT